MNRRTLLFAAATLAAPRIGNARAAKPLRVVPDSDITVLDPVAGTTNIQTRDHAFMVFDTPVRPGQFVPRAASDGRGPCHRKRWKDLESDLA